VRAELSQPVGHPPAGALLDTNTEDERCES